MSSNLNSSKFHEILTIIRGNHNAQPFFFPGEGLEAQVATGWNTFIKYIGASFASLPEHKEKPQELHFNFLLKHRWHYGFELEINFDSDNTSTILEWRLFRKQDKKI